MTDAIVPRDVSQLHAVINALYCLRFQCGIAVSAELAQAVDGLATQLLLAGCTDEVVLLVVASDLTDAEALRTIVPNLGSDGQASRNTIELTFAMIGMARLRQQVAWNAKSLEDVYYFVSSCAVDDDLGQLTHLLNVLWSYELTPGARYIDECEAAAVAKLLDHTFDAKRSVLSKYGLE